MCVGGGAGGSLPQGISSQTHSYHLSLGVVANILDYPTASMNFFFFSSRGTSSFIVRVNTAAESSANFILKYEELLVRRLSMYQQTISFNPGQVVEDSLLTVRVVEIQGISNSDVPSYVQTETMSDQEKIFTYAPTIDEQQTVLDQALTRDVAISYDVNHPGDESAGLFVVNECVFAHFFSPSGVESIPVDLVFIIDTSGSMSGTKIEQTRDALESIINKMRPTDRLSLLTFDSDIEYWKQELVLVSEFRQQAIQYARSLQADGSTNFNAGLLAGADILKQYGNPTYVQLMVILTDGQPTAGVTNPTEIQRNAEEALKGTRISLNCLGFGYDLNYELLEKLALNNNGIPRQIYEGNDAQDQLEGFFEEISSPILSEITITYSESVVESSTDTMFPLLFEGSELVVAGKLSCSADSITVSISGTGSTEAATFSTTVDISADTNIAGFKPSTPRLRAYLHIQQLLKKRLVAESEEEIAEIEARALGLALENNFVTELTSLIVVEENTNKTLNSDGDDLEAGPNGDLELDYDGGYGPGYFPSAGKAMVASISMILNAALLVAIYCH